MGLGKKVELSNTSGYLSQLNITSKDFVNEPKGAREWQTLVKLFRELGGYWTLKTPNVRSTKRKDPKFKYCVTRIKPKV